MNLIAFTGSAYSGKTTAADSLVADGWIRTSFAQPLRDMLEAMGVPPRFLRDDKADPIPMLGYKVTGRYLMQTLGTEWGRNMISEDLWIRLAKMRIAMLLDEGASIVIDDLRFDNEAQMVRDLGGAVVLIERPFGSKLKHISEQGVHPNLVNIKMNNDSATPKEFQEKVAEVFRQSRGSQTVPAQHLPS